MKATIFVLALAAAAAPAATAGTIFNGLFNIGVDSSSNAYLDTSGQTDSHFTTGSGYYAATYYYGVPWYPDQTRKRSLFCRRNRRADLLPPGADGGRDPGDFPRGCGGEKAGGGGRTSPPRRPIAGLDLCHPARPPPAHQHGFLPSVLLRVAHGCVKVC